MPAGLGRVDSGRAGVHGRQGLASGDRLADRTSTAVTLPETANFRLAWLDGSIVPEVDTVCWMVPVVTATTDVETTKPVGVDDPEVSQ